MKTISQIAQFRQSVVGYSQRFSIQEAMNRFNVSRATVYRWRKRYDGSAASLMDRSRRPHHHPKQHTEEELKLIFNMRRRSPNLGLVVFWVKLRQRGYSRSVTSLWRVLRRQKLQPVKPPSRQPIIKTVKPAQTIAKHQQTIADTTEIRQPETVQKIANFLIFSPMFSNIKPLLKFFKGKKCANRS